MALAYATYTPDMRYQDIEESVLSNPWCAYRYVIEHVIPNNRVFSVAMYQCGDYLRIVESSGADYSLHPWPEAVPVILRDPVVTLQYMMKFNLCRWAPGVTVVNNDKRTAPRYAKWLATMDAAYRRASTFNDSKPKE